MSVRMNIFYNEPKCLPLETEYQTTHLLLEAIKVVYSFIKNNFIYL